jgi:hypothetical protein
VGGTVDVEVSVTNRGANKATGVLLAVEPSGGVSIKSMQGRRTRCDTADATALQCFLGDILRGETVPVTVSASIDAPGAGQIYFSAGHRGAHDGSDRSSTTVVIETKRITLK